MKCDNIFCLYWSDNQCSNDNVSIGINGACNDCVILDTDLKTKLALRYVIINSFNDENFIKRKPTAEK